MQNKCRSRIREMLKIKLNSIDIMRLLLQEFKDLSYTTIRNLIFEEVEKRDTDNATIDSTNKNISS